MFGKIVFFCLIFQFMAVVDFSQNIIDFWLSCFQYELTKAFFLHDPVVQSNIFAVQRLYSAFSTWQSVTLAGQCCHQLSL